jgi:ABC-2 type transport system permease protein
MAWVCAATAPSEGDDLRGVARYVRLLTALARFGLARELAFRGSFVVRVAVEVIWLAIMIVFYRTVFGKTPNVAGWNEPQYLFFLGCYFALGGLIETLFLSNCTEFAELVRSGNLDFYLLKPIDEQFLITCRDIDWSTAPNVLMGAGVMVVALGEMHWTFDSLRLLGFLGLFLCGVAIAYSFLLLLTSTSIWFVRNQNLMEAWWLFTSLMRYPRAIFMEHGSSWAYLLGVGFSFVLPIMLVVNVPADLLVRALADPWLIGFTVGSAVVLLAASRAFFLFSLRRYRSASS